MASHNTSGSSSSKLLWVAMGLLSALLVLLWLPAMAPAMPPSPSPSWPPLAGEGNDTAQQLGTTPLSTPLQPSAPSRDGGTQQKINTSSPRDTGAVVHANETSGEQSSSPLVTARNRTIVLTEADVKKVRVTAADHSVCPTLFPIDIHRDLYTKLEAIHNENPKTTFHPYDLPYLLDKGSLLTAPEELYPFHLLKGTTCINKGGEGKPQQSGGSNTTSAGSSETTVASAGDATINDVGEYISHEGTPTTFRVVPKASDGIRVASHARLLPSAAMVEHGLLLVVLVIGNTFHATQDTFIPVANLINTRFMHANATPDDGVSMVRRRFPVHLWVKFNTLRGGTATAAAKEIVRMLAADLNIASVRVGEDLDGPRRRCFSCGLYVGEHGVHRKKGNVTDIQRMGERGGRTPYASTLTAYTSNAHREAAVSMLRAQMAKAFNAAPYGFGSRLRAAEEAIAIWKTPREQETATSKRAWMPRLLLVGRRENRKIGNIDALEEIAVKAGFNVKKMYFDGMAFSEQFRLVRYADVLVSIHGAALTWMLALDTETILVGADNKTMRSGHNCRTVLELRHWGRKFRGDHNVYKGFSTDGHILHLDMAGSTVAFDPGINAKRATKILMNKKFPHGLPEFHKQTVFYDPASFRVVMQHLLDHLDRCLFF